MVGGAAAFSSLVRAPTPLSPRWLWVVAVVFLFLFAVLWVVRQWGAGCGRCFLFFLFFQGLGVGATDVVFEGF